MCGILGSVGDNITFLEKDLQSISHRGPDSHGFFRHNNISLGHTRLSILDLTKNGHQPMFSNDNKYCIVFNGEIYNHQDIRNDLINFGYKFNSNTDTETLLNAYIHWGDKFLIKLNGIFAFAILNLTTNNIFFARDQVGVKPFYFYLDNHNFCFSSELKTFNDHDYINKDIDYNALLFYLQNLYTPNDLTPFSKIKKLLPGHCGNYNINTRECKITKYYEINFNENLIKYNENELIEKLDYLLIQSVKRQLLSDVPIGFFLSGGLDSSLLVAIATNLLGFENIQCFTISSGKSMLNEGFSDDEYYAKIVAKHLGIKLNVIDTDSNILKDLDNIIWHLDEPQADPATIHVRNISKMAKKLGFKVLIGGVGGDDLFSGYRRHQALQIETFITYIPQFLLKFLNYIIRLFKFRNPTLRRLKKLINSFILTKNERLASYYCWIDERNIYDLFTKNSIKKINSYNKPIHFFKSIIQNLPLKYKLLNKLLFVEQTTFLPHHNLNYTDKMGMSEGIEIRVPFLDIELLEFANSLPVQYKMKNVEVKYLLKKVAEKYLPKEVIYREKTGFGSPLRFWIKKDFNFYLNNDLFKENNKKNDVFDYNKIEKFVKDSNNDLFDGSYTFLAILSIESWLNQFKK